jgi:type IV pilus assembly protein PilO
MELGIDPIAILRMKAVEKLGVAIAILVIIAAGYWYFFYGEREAAINTLDQALAKQHAEIQKQREELKRLPILREELAQLKLKETELKQELPSSKEIPKLLEDISLAGHAQGLTFMDFAPQKEVPKQYYEEVPVQLRITGPFHATVVFMNRVARLPRIVNITDVVMTPGGGKNSDGPMTLNTSARATTYRYLEIKPSSKKKKSSKSKKR